MYQNRYIQYLNFPEIPEDIVQNFLQDFDAHLNHTNKVVYRETYIWSDLQNSQLNSWGQTNICHDMYFAFQMMKSDAPLHQDKGTLTKLNYIISPGGHNVLTEFYDFDTEQCLASYNIVPKRWHILKADSWHCVKNIEPDSLRFMVTAKVF